MRNLNSVALAVMVALEPGPCVVKELPQSERVEGLLQNPVVPGALSEVVGIRDEDRTPRNPRHLGHGAGVVSDVVQHAKGAHDVEAVVAKRQSECISIDQLLSAETLLVADLT